MTTTKTGTMKRDHVYTLEIQLDEPGCSETSNTGGNYRFDLAINSKKKKPGRFESFAQDIRSAVESFWKAGGR